MKALHTIKQQVLNLSTNGKLDTWLLQNKLKEILTSEVSTRLDRVCCDLSVSNKEIVYVDKIELDIGKINLKDLDTTWAAKIESAFREELKQLLTRTSANKPDDQNTKNNNAHTKLNYLLFFLHHGTLPWWGNSFRNQTLDKLLSDVIKQQPKELTATFINTVDSNNLIKRFVYQFSDESFTNLLTLLTSNDTTTYFTHICEACYTLQGFANKKIVVNVSKEVSLLQAIHSTSNNLDLIKNSLTLIEALATKNTLPKKDFLLQLINSLQKFSQSKPDFRSATREHKTTLLRLIAELRKLAHNSDSLPLSANSTYLQTQPITTTADASTTEVLNLNQNAAMSFEEFTSHTPTQKTSAVQNKEVIRNVTNKTISIQSDAPTKNTNIDYTTKKSGHDKFLSNNSSTPNESNEGGVDSSINALVYKKITPHKKHYQDIQKNTLHSDQPAANKPSVNENTPTNVPEHSVPPTATENVDPPEHVHKIISIENQASHNPTFYRETEVPYSPSLLRKEKKEIVEKNVQSDGFPDKSLASEEIQESYLPNAGLVLLSPYLNRFFRNLHLLTEATFTNMVCRTKAIILLHYLINDQPDVSEYNLLLNKIICGLPIGTPIDKHIFISDEEKNQCHQFLQAVIENWPSLKNTSVRGFQEAFLDRPGVLRKKEQGWVLTVERKSYDMIMETLPWSINLVKFTWMEKPLYVEW